MIYKKHELSLSLNGDEIMHIARNTIGNVVFRENSEKDLKRAIDDYIKELQYQEQLAEEKKSDESATIEDVKSPDEVLVPQKRVTRGPDGKFISKSQLDTDEDLKKKTFWDKLTS